MDLALKDGLNDGLMLKPETLNLDKVGMPRILKKIDSDGSIRWYMWLQGRETGFGGGELPELSTGRIFFLDSVDGLNDWSLREDNPVLNPNKEGDGDWWFFDAEHVGLGDVCTPGGSAASKFATEAGVYLMYTYGGNSDKVTINDKDFKGMRMEIGVCVSQDGVHWSRIEGPNPYGSILEPGEHTDFDGQMIGWPVVIEDGRTYRMYYSTYSPIDKKFIVGMALSADGIKWEKRGQVFSGGGPSGAGDAAVDGDTGRKGTFDAMGVSRRSIVKDASNKVAPYKMWYEGISKSGEHAIGIATSLDGENWERVGASPIFNASAVEGAWDSGGVGSPHLVYLEDKKRWRLYYVGSGSGADKEKYSIGVAESTDEEGLYFQRVPLP